MKLRPYQDAAHDAVLEAFSRHDSVLVDMATGLGKTVLFTGIAHRWTAGRVLVIAHREELIDQAADKIGRTLGPGEFGIEMGERQSIEGGSLLDKPKVLIASVQTMCRERRQAKFNPGEFGLMIIDEAHHAVARSYRDVIDFVRSGNPQCKLLGVTATPKRADQLAMGQLFDHVAYSYQIERAVEDGWLVPVRQELIEVEGLDFSNVKTVAGDLNEGELEAILTEEKNLHAIARPTLDKAGDRPALLFCVSVAHARLMAAILNRYKPYSAEFLSGETPKEMRREVIGRYRSGKLQFLCNCALFLEGFDAPNTALVVMGRPTKSLALYTQVLGRGTRPLPGIVDDPALVDAAGRREAIATSAKPSMTVLDFVGNSGRHKIITSYDVLAGRWGEPVKAEAKKNAQTDSKEGREPLTTEEAMDRAEAELSLSAQVLDRRRRVKAAAARYRSQPVNPFGPGSAAPVAVAENVKRRGEPATPNQVRYLVYLGVPRDKAEAMSKGQAGAVISKLQRGQTG